MKSKLAIVSVGSNLIISSVFCLLARAEIPDLLRETLIFHYDVVAQEGQNGITLVQPYPSLNDSAVVAFVGRTGEGESAKENVYTWVRDDTGAAMLRPMFHEGLAPHVEGASPRQSFAADVQINNQSLVLVRRYLTTKVQIGFPLGDILDAPLTYLELYQALSNNQYHVPQVAMGNAGFSGVTILNPLWAGWLTWGVGTEDLVNIASPYNPSTPFAAILQWGALNNVGQVAFNALADQNYFMTRPRGNWLGAPLGGGRLRAQMADTGYFAYRNVSGSAVRIASYDFSSIINIATTSSYQSVGAQPGISDDGHVVAFAATVTANGRASPGLYVAVDISGGAMTSPFLVAGASDNGILDPGETFEDLNANGVFDPAIGERDIGRFADFDLGTQVAVQHSEGSEYFIAFIANVAPDRSSPASGARRSLCLVRVDVSDRSSPLRGFGVVTTVGRPVGDPATGLVTSGDVEEVSIHDPINVHGDVAFWVRTSLGTHILKTTTMPSDVEVVDYNHPEFRLSRHVILDFERLKSPGIAVRGLTADGVSTVLLRTRAYDQPGFVQMIVEASDDNSRSPEDVGELRNGLDPDQLVNGRLMPLVEDPYSPGSFRAFYLLTAPKDFVRVDGLNEALDQTRGFARPRKLNVKATFIPDNGDSWRAERTLLLHRPPVVLVHGIHDKGASWNWALQQDSRFRVRAPSYQDANGDWFRINVPRVRDFILDAIKDMNDQGIATVQADVFGHSMGGLLSRLYATDDQIPGFDTNYRRDDNFEQGDIHKLITVNSPNWGSPVASTLVTSDNHQTTVGDGIEVYFERWKMEVRCLTCGALNDLRPDSERIAELNSVPIAIPVHAIIGLGGDTAESPQKYGRDKRFLTRLYGLSIGRVGLKPSDLFCGDNDTAVGEDSQRAGLSSAQCTVTVGSEGLHFPTIAEFPNGASSRAAADLLNASIASSKFAIGFPFYAPWDFPLINGPAECGAAEQQKDEGVFDAVQVLPAQRVEKALNVLVLPSKQLYEPGEWVEVEVVPTNGFELDTTWVAVQDGELIETNGGVVRVSLRLPDWIGVVRIDALGIDILGRLGTSLGVKIELATTQAVTEVKLTPAEIRFYPNSSASSFSVSAVYADGVERRLANGTPGLTLSNSNTNVAWVSPDGVLAPLAFGRTLVTVRFGTNEDAAPVVVKHAPSFEVQTNYAQWATILPQGQRDPMATPFEDDLPNLARFVFGIVPSTNASRANLPRTAGIQRLHGREVLTVEYTLGVGVSTTNAIPQLSNDLVKWEDLRVGANPYGLYFYNSGRTFRVLVPLEAPQSFIRVRLASP